MAGDILDLEVALAPCTVGYGEIALAIEAEPDALARRQPLPILDRRCMPARNTRRWRAAPRRGSMRSARAMAGRRASPRLAADFAKAARLEQASGSRGCASVTAGAGASAPAPEAVRCRRRLMRVLVAMSGGVDSSVVAGLLKRSRARGDRRDAAALRPRRRRRRRRAPAAPGQDIHDARRVADALGIPHYVLDREARFRARGDRGFRRHLCPRRDADPLHPLQPDGEVPATWSRWPATSAARRWPPATTRAAWMAPDGAELHRAADPARDQSYFLAADHARRSWTSRASRSATCRTRRRCARWPARLGLAVAEQARQPGHLLRARGPLRRAGRASCARRRAGARRDRAPPMAGCSARIAASRATRSGRGRGLGAARDGRAAACRRRGCAAPARHRRPARCAAAAARSSPAR